VVPLFGESGQYPKDWPVTAYFSAEPKVEEFKVPNLIYAGKASLDDPRRSLVLYRFVYPFDANLDMDRADAVVKEMFLTSESRVLEREGKIKIGDFPAKRIVIADYSAMGVIEIRVLIFRNELYFIMYVRPFATEPSGESKAFFAGIKAGPNQLPDPMPPPVAPPAGAGAPHGTADR
jgi:hypothetical protein